MCRRCLTEAVARCAESLARVGDSEAARVLLRREEPLPSDVHNCFWWRRARAVLAVSLGESSALVALEDVIAEAERQDLSLEALWARLDLATLLTRTDKTRAAKTLRAVGAEAEKVGARTEQMVAEQRLRALGVRTWRRGAAQLSTTDRLAQLSDREREIATLVASGANNREIAATVFLSRKTVERHVSNILAKSGVRNRAELAALAALPEQRRGAADS